MQMGRKTRSVTKLTLLALGCLLALAGCQHATAQSRLEIVEKDAFSTHTEKGPQFQLISDRNLFDDAYQHLHEGGRASPEKPAVDYTKQRVLLAFMGQKSTAGYSIDFQPATAIAGDALVVTVILTKPPTGAVLAQVVTSPYALATLPRTGYQRVKLVDTSGETLAVLEVE